MRDASCGMGVPPVQKGRAGRPSHCQECKLFNSRSLVHTQQLESSGIYRISFFTRAFYSLHKK